MHPRTIPRRLLFELGALSLLPPLVVLLEPVRRRVLGLQRSTIHIEHAYYCYIAQLLPTYQLPPTPRAPQPLPHLLNLPNLPNLPHLPHRPHLPHLPPIFLVGDSHALAASWRVVQWRGAARLLRPVTVTGLKALPLVRYMEHFLVHHIVCSHMLRDALHRALHRALHTGTNERPNPSRRGTCVPPPASTRAPASTRRCGGEAATPCARGCNHMYVYVCTQVRRLPDGAALITVLGQIDCPD